MARRTYALTGDRINLAFALNGAPMGSVLAPSERRELVCDVIGGAPIDCVDVIKNGSLLRRFSTADVATSPETRAIRTRLLLEVGWGAKGRRVDWDVRFGISDGTILDIEPRFRGAEIVAPQEAVDGTPAPDHTSHWEPDGDRAVWFRTVTHGNPNNRTPATQAMCLEVEVPPHAEVWAELNGQRIVHKLSKLQAGARAGRLAKIDSPSYLFHRAPTWSELQWQATFVDSALPAPGSSPVTPHPPLVVRDWYYVRVRQTNDEWAWSSPIWVAAAT